jgi:hypothetical protein
MIRLWLSSSVGGSGVCAAMAAGSGNVVYRASVREAVFINDDECPSYLSGPALRVSWLCALWRSVSLH